MMLETVFKYVKEHGPCDVHDIAKKLRISEKQCLDYLLELHDRGAIKQETHALDNCLSNCFYSARVSEFHEGL